MHQFLDFTGKTLAISFGLNFSSPIAPQDYNWCFSVEILTTKNNKTYKKASKVAIKNHIFKKKNHISRIKYEIIIWI